MSTKVLFYEPLDILAFPEQLVKRRLFVVWSNLALVGPDSQSHVLASEAYEQSLDDNVALGPYMALASTSCISATPTSIGRR